MQINRTTLTLSDIEEGLKLPIVKKQIELMKLRNTSSAFYGTLEIDRSSDELLILHWINGLSSARLSADLRRHSFQVAFTNSTGVEEVHDFD